MLGEGACRGDWCRKKPQTICALSLQHAPNRNTGGGEERRPAPNITVRPYRRDSAELVPGGVALYYLRDISDSAGDPVPPMNGTITWTGTAEAVALGIADDNCWDYVALVRYPSRKAFIAMMTSPDYARANVERENGCAAHTILAIRETYNKLMNTPTKE